MRELDSLIRSVLAAPMEALPQEDEHQAKKRAAALCALKDMQFDEATLQRAEKALKPQLNHRTQIEKIVKQLGLAPDGDIAKLWFELTKVVEFAHQRSFHERLEADAAFRAEFALKVDTVIRAVVTQLQDRYTALTRRAKEIATLRPAQGVKLFRREIPGALPLLRYFYDNLSEDWLPFLEKEGLLGEPLPDEQLADVSQLRAWPAGQYLVRMASSTNEETRAIAGAHAPGGGIVHACRCPACRARCGGGVTSTGSGSGGRSRGRLADARIRAALGLTACPFEAAGRRR